MRRVIAINPIDGNLQFLQSGLVERLNQFGTQKKAVGNHTCAEKAKLAATANESGKFGVQRGFAASERDTEGAELFHFLQASFQNLHRDRLARFVVLGAVAAGKVTAADYDHLRQKWTVTEAKKIVGRSHRGRGGEIWGKHEGLGHTTGLCL